MEWPAELIATFLRGVKITPLPEFTPRQVVYCILDETTRRAVWRAGADPAKLGDALRTPFTPLGSVVPGEMQLWAVRLSFAGPGWGEAVDAFNAFLEENAAAVCAAFKDEMQPYDSDIGFGW